MYQGLPEQKRLLDAIAAGEASGYGYDQLYNGGTFSNEYADHPRQLQPITTGPNAGQKSSAAGRYQFLSNTWDENAKELGLTNFSPENQDTAAWHLANKTYNSKTGRDLLADLKSGDTSRVAPSLSGIWTSIPGGLEPNKASGGFNNRLVDKMAGIDDYMYGDPTPKGRGALFSPPQAPAAQAPQEQPSFMQNLLQNGTGAFFGVPNSEGLGSQLQNAGAGLMAINNPSALSLIASSRAKQATAPYEVHIGRDGTAYRINKVTGEMTKMPGGNDEKKASEEAQRKQTADIVTQDIDRVGNIVNGAGLPATGAAGYALQGLPGTNSHDVNKLLDSIKSNVSFDKLQQMRASSPTGGALGAVSDFENKLLQSTLGSLEQSQSKEQFMQNLQRVKQTYSDIIHKGVKDTSPQQGAPQAPNINIPGVRSIKQIN